MCALSKSPLRKMSPLEDDVRNSSSKLCLFSQARSDLNSGNCNLLHPTSLCIIIVCACIRLFSGGSEGKSGHAPIQFDYIEFCPSNKEINVRYWDILNWPVPSRIPGSYIYILCYLRLYCNNNYRIKKRP